MNISTAAKNTGLTAKTIRFYEKKGLITPANRCDNGYREYNDRHLRELSFIHHARELGFTLKECADLLNLYKDQERRSADVKTITLRKIANIEQKIHQLQTIRDSLKNLSECCHGDKLPDCPILDRLAKEP